jgi:hypothetical protein
VQLTLVLDHTRSAFTLRGPGVDESHRFGSWPECEGELVDRVARLRAAGFAPVDGEPRGRVLTSLAKYTELVVAEQKAASAGRDIDAKKRWGFKSKKEYGDECAAWYAYLLGEPELKKQVDAAQAAVTS